MSSVQANRWPGPVNLAEMLPNHDFEVLKGHPGSMSDAVVVGSIVDVRPGKAFVIIDAEPGFDGDPSLEVDFDDASADWRTVHMTVQIEDLVGPTTLARGKTVDVAFTLRGGPIEFDRAAKSFAASGRSVFFVQGNTKWVDDVEGVHRLAYEGGSTMSVAEDGNLALPFYKADLSFLAAEPVHLTQPVSVGATLDELRRLAEGPVVLVQAGS